MHDIFDNTDSVEVRRIIRRARLSKEDRRIAMLRFVDCLSLSDIGAEVHLDRSSVGYRLRRRIIPKLIAGRS